MEGDVLRVGALSVGGSSFAGILALSIYVRVLGIDALWLRHFSAEGLASTDMGVVC